MRHTTQHIIPALGRFATGVISLPEDARMMGCVIREGIGSAKIVTTNFFMWTTPPHTNSKEHRAMEWQKAKDRYSFDVGDEFIVASLFRLTPDSDVEWIIEHVYVTYVDEYKLQINPIEGGEWQGDWNDVQYYLSIKDMTKELPPIPTPPVKESSDNE